MATHTFGQGADMGDAGTMVGPGEGAVPVGAATLLERADAVPTAGFKARATDLPTDMRTYAAQAFGGWTEAYLAGFKDGVLETTPLRDAAYGALQAYMAKRFGPANRSGDPDKQLCAGWVLDTPDPDVFVAIRPSVAGVALSFTPMMAIPDRPSWKHDDPRIHRIAAAYRATLVDLLRPVFVRDMAIDALGRADDSPFPAVHPHPASCAGVPPAMVAGDGWADLVGIARALRGGDLAAGRDAAAAMLAGIVLGRTADLPREARVLASARLRAAGRADMAGAIPLDGADAAQATALANELDGFVRSGAPHPLLDDKATLEASTEILRSVGLLDDVAERLAAFRYERDWTALANRIFDSVGDGFDRSLLPASVHDVDAFPSILRGQGHEGAAAMADEALATPRGRGLLGMAIRLIEVHLPRPDAPAP